MPDIISTGSTYPPASIIALLPFGFGGLGLLAWLVVDFGLFFAGLWAALRRDLGARTPIAFAFALLGLCFFLPFADAVITANVNLALAGIYAWCWAVGRSDGRIGALAGLGGAMKLVPVVLALWPTGQARRRSVLLAILVMIGMTVLTIPIVGVQSWFDFVSVLSNATPACDGGRISIPCLIGPTVGFSAGRGIALAIGAGFLILALWVKRDRLAFVLFGAAMLAPVADMHPHYWLFAYVAGVVVIAGVSHHSTVAGRVLRDALAVLPGELPAHETDRGP